MSIAMMQRVLWYLPIAAVMAPLATGSWIHGGACASSLTPAMYFASAACAASLLLPQCRGPESLRSARWRALKGLLRDPLLWLALGLALYLCIPLFNVALCPVCDRAAIVAGTDSRPPFPWLPFCVNPREHSGVLLWFGPAFLVALGVRHALSRSGQKAFFELMVWNGTFLSAYGFAQILAVSMFGHGGGSHAMRQGFSVFGYPNMGGCFFAVNYAFSLGLWCYRMEQREGASGSFSRECCADRPRHVFLRTHYPCIAVALSFFAALTTMSRAAISLIAAITVIFFVYVVIRLLFAKTTLRPIRFRTLPVVGFAFVALFLSVFLYAPPEVGKELRSLNCWIIADRVSGKAQYHGRVASAIMRDFPLFGVGGWGYRHFCLPYMTEEELRKFQRLGGANVHNDYLQFLAEHGIAGCALLLACMAMVLAPLVSSWKAMAREYIHSARAGMGGASSVAFTVSPPVLWTLIGCMAILVHAFGDCPFRSSANMTFFISSLAATVGFLPSRRMWSPTTASSTTRPPSSRRVSARQSASTG